MDVRRLLDEPQRVFAVILQEGDEIASSIERFARSSKVDAASFTGIGAVSAATLGFFDPEARTYRKIEVAQQAEIVSLVGDITTSAPGEDASRTVHGHMALALSNGHMRGGHLLSATARPTLELVVTELPAHLRRRHDPNTGLTLIDAGPEG